MYCDRRGNGQKPTRTKPPDKNLCEQLRQNLYRGLLSGIFVLGLLKIGGFEMCEVLLGVPGCVTKCDRGGGSKLAKNSVTYFMDGPKGLVAIYTMSTCSMSKVARENIEIRNKRHFLIIVQKMFLSQLRVLKLFFWSPILRPLSPAPEDNCPPCPLPYATVRQISRQSSKWKQRFRDIDPDPNQERDFSVWFMLMKMMMTLMIVLLLMMMTTTVVMLMAMIMINLDNDADDVDDVIVPSVEAVVEVCFVRTEANPLRNLGRSLHFMHY